MTVPFITFLSDYGLEDDFVGTCHGVIAMICPQARVIDLTHGVRRHDIGAGAVILAQSMPFVPAGVHLAVVDPEVGAQRRAVAVSLADERLLVGPDNGLLWLAAQAAGGVMQAVDISRSRFRLEPVSPTFHGRDIFAPVAAQLAAGSALAETGDPLDRDELVKLELPEARHQDGALVTHVRHIDRFGNLQLNAGHGELSGSGLKLGRPATVQPAGRAAYDLTYVRTFADVAPGEPLLYEDAARRLSVAVNHGDAAEWLGVGVNDELWLRAT